MGNVAGRIGIAALSVLLIFTGATLEDAERSLFSITFDASWLYVLAGVIGLVTVFVHRLTAVWAVAMTIPTLGRAVTLVIDGGAFDVPRVVELRGALVWLVLWLMGGLCCVVVEGSASIRRYVAGR